MTSFVVSASSLPTLLNPQWASPIPNLLRGVFGIGCYQSITGGDLFETSFPSISQPNVLLHPYGGTYGGTNGFVLDTTIRAPQQASYTPAQSIGLDTTGLDVVRGFPQLTWTWNTLRPDHWYYFMGIWKKAQYAPPGFKALVLVQYPDTSSNTPQVTLARMEPPTHASRDVGSYQGITIKFSYVGQAQLAPDVLVQVLS